MPVHPHVCGEIGRSLMCIIDTTGSPPRMWEYSLQRLEASFSPSVHPHVCGENVVNAIFAYSNSVHPHVCGENISL